MSKIANSDYDDLLEVYRDCLKNDKKLPKYILKSECLSEISIKFLEYYFKEFNVMSRAEFVKNLDENLIKKAKLYDIYKTLYKSDLYSFALDLYSDINFFELNHYKEYLKWSNKMAILAVKYVVSKNAWDFEMFFYCDDKKYFFEKENLTKALDFFYGNVEYALYSAYPEEYITYSLKKLDSVSKYLNDLFVVNLLDIMFKMNSDLNSVKNFEIMETFSTYDIDRFARGIYGKISTNYGLSFNKKIYDGSTNNIDCKYLKYICETVLGENKQFPNFIFDDYYGYDNSIFILKYILKDYLNIKTYEEAKEEFKYEDFKSYGLLFMLENIFHNNIDIALKKVYIEQDKDIKTYLEVLTGKRKTFPKNFLPKDDALKLKKANLIMEYVIDKASKSVNRKDVINNLSKGFFLKHKVYGIYNTCYNSTDKLLENIYFGKYKTDN